MEMPRRMSKAQRREQLLQVAYEIIRSEGTEELTLARVAEQAGVTKPIAYEHFGTRSGLLIALYQDYDKRQTEAMRVAIETGGKTIEDVAFILSAAYVDCAVSSGPEIGAITAALSATEEMEDLLQACRDSFTEECQEALAPFIEMPRQQSDVLFVGIVGAVESLSQAAATGRVSRDAAVSTLAQMMVSSFKPRV